MPDAAAARRALIARAPQGKSDDSDDCTDAHEPPDCRLALCMSGDGETAKQELRERLLATLRELSEVRGASALTTWVYRIARRACQRLRARTLDSDVVLDAAEALASAISALPPQERQVIALCDVERRRPGEVAQILAIDLGAVERRLHRARTAVRRHIHAFLND